MPLYYTFLEISFGNWFVPHTAPHKPHNNRGLLLASPDIFPCLSAGVRQTKFVNRDKQNHEYSFVITQKISKLDTLKSIQKVFK